MKLKLSKEDLEIFINALKSCDGVSFNTHYESRLMGCILKEFILQLMSKFMKDQPSYKISLSDKQLLVLNFIIPQLHIIDDPYTELVVREVYHEIHKACLSI